MIALYGNGFIDYLYDEMELGKRVACFLDSENNTPEIHFLGWDLPMTTAELEVQIAESTPDEHMECNLCKRSTPREDVFPLGTQDPLNKVTAVIITCRGCFVGALSLDLRRAIYALWDV